MLEHGGRVRQAAARWGVAETDWLDLSTGIAPWGYPVGVLPEASWRRLPEDDDELETAARRHYGTDRLLPLPGSQAAIQALPRLRPAGVVAAPAPGYGEYARAAARAGHIVLPYAGDELARVAAEADIAFVCNPNNPTGARHERDELLAVAARLRQRDGWLVVDEAFADCDPGASLASLAGSATADNVVVLRSLGKFFGLAGARVGFAIAAPEILMRLAESVGPWAVMHPARVAATRALDDIAWQEAQRERLRNARARLVALLEGRNARVTGATALFAYTPTADATLRFEQLARQGILVRRFEAPAALRFGLPGTEAEWNRLAAGLAACG